MSKMKSLFKIPCLIVSISIGSLGVGWSELDYNEYKGLEAYVSGDYLTAYKYFKNSSNSC